jgi:hypothetical protein
MNEITYVLTWFLLLQLFWAFYSSCPSAVSQLITAAVMGATMDEITCILTGLKLQHLIQGLL